MSYEELLTVANESTRVARKKNFSIHFPIIHFGYYPFRGDLLLMLSNDRKCITVPIKWLHMNPQRTKVNLMDRLEHS